MENTVGDLIVFKDARTLEENTIPKMLNNA